MSVEMIKQQAILEKLLKKAENKECADCRTKSPSWASILFGTFICIRCSGFHRELSTSYAKVKSVDLDKWPNGVAELYTKIDNNVANKYWENKLDENDINRKKLKDDDNYLRDFIFDKYQRKRWAAKGKCPMTKLYEGEDISNLNYGENLSKSSSTNSEKKESDIKKTFSSKSNVSNGMKESTHNSNSNNVTKNSNNDLKISEVKDDIFNFESNNNENNKGNDQKYKFGFIDKNKNQEGTFKNNSECKTITDDIFNFSNNSGMGSGSNTNNKKEKDEFDFGFETKEDKLSKILNQIDINSNNEGNKVNNSKNNNNNNDIFNMLNQTSQMGNNFDHQKYLANNINFNSTNINVNNNYYNSFNLGTNVNGNGNNQGLNYNNFNNNQNFNPNNYFGNNGTYQNQQQNQFFNQNNVNKSNMNVNSNSKIQLNYEKTEYSMNSKSSNNLYGGLDDMTKKESNKSKKGDPFSDLLKL